MRSTLTCAVCGATYPWLARLAGVLAEGSMAAAFCRRCARILYDAQRRAKAAEAARLAAPGASGTPMPPLAPMPAAHAPAPVPAYDPVAAYLGTGYTPLRPTSATRRTPEREG